jgi:hypothetical protein
MGSKFSAAVQTDPGAQPASWKIGIDLFPGNKAAEAWR